MFKKILLMAIIGVLGFTSLASATTTLAQRLSGTILLQVEANGEAWYVNPTDSMRYYMKDGAIAYQMMRNFGLGITDTDLTKIPSVSSTSEMKLATSICSINATANRLKGKILLQVQQHGEAWYIYPKTCRRIYMKDGEAAYGIMRFLGLGITNKDLSLINVNENFNANPTNTVSEPAQTPAPTPTITPTPTPAPTPTPTANTVINDIVLNGNGQQVTNKFKLEAGLSLFELNNTGSSNFIVKLLDSQGQYVDLLANEIGNTVSESVVGIETAGDYVIVVDSDGSWNITIKQPRNLTGALPPTTLTGNGQQVKYFSSNGGLTTFELTHTGSSNFIVKILTSNGKYEDLIVNEIGNFTGSTAIGLDKGVYVLTIDADGEWSIKIK